MKEGYFLIALGGGSYYMMTYHLCKSIRLFHDFRPISLLTDKEGIEYFKKLNFHFVFDIEEKKYKWKSTFTSNHDKFGILPRLFFDLSPYDKSIYIDSDCLITDSTDKLWEISRLNHFNCLGLPEMSPNWRGANPENIKKLNNELGFKFPECHAGITWFDKNNYSYNTMKDIENFLIYKYNNKIFNIFPKHKKGIKNNDVSLSYALGKNKVCPIKYNTNVMSINPARVFLHQKNNYRNSFFYNQELYKKIDCEFDFSKNFIICHLENKKNKHVDYSLAKTLLKNIQI